MIKTVEKTFCCARIHSADLLKSTMAELEWVRHFSEFCALLAETVQRYDGEMVRSLGDGVLVAFDRVDEAVQSAVDFQEALNGLSPYATTGISCKMGIAIGQATALCMDDRKIDYMGLPVDIADRLSDRAHGNAILLFYPHTEPAGVLKIHSQAGTQQGRASEAYFIEQPPCQLRGIKQIIHGYSVFWQATPGNYLTAAPAAECRPVGTPEAPSQEITYFGKVTAFKKERGFGFIQYYTDDHVYKEVYFHMTYVVGQVPVNENDHVQFVIKPGKEGRPQACSVLVMGSRLQGQVESLEANGSCHISIRNQASEVIRFFGLPQQVQDIPLQKDDIVEFTVASGSDSEGLVALDMVLHQEESLSQQSDLGDDLPLGITEQAVVTAYFTEKGYGFAKCRRNNIYVHVSELTDPELIPHPGDLIEFEVTPGRDSTYRANNIRFIKRKSMD